MGEPAETRCLLNTRASAGRSAGSNPAASARNGRVAELVYGSGPENRRSRRGSPGSESQSFRKQARVAKRFNAPVRNTGTPRVRIPPRTPFQAGLAQLAERGLCTPQVAGPIPASGSMNVPVAQLAEHVTFNHGVAGPIPAGDTKVPCSSADFSLPLQKQKRNEGYGTYMHIVDMRPLQTQCRPCRVPQLLHHGFREQPLNGTRSGGLRTVPFSLKQKKASLRDAAPARTSRL